MLAEEILKELTAEELQEIYGKLLMSGDEKALDKLHDFLGYYNGFKGNSSPELLEIFEMEVNDPVSAEKKEKLLLDLISKGHFIYDDVTKKTGSDVAYDAYSKLDLVNYMFLTMIHHPNYNVHAKNKSGRTPLHLAAIYGHHELVPILLAKGANVRAFDLHPLTPLHIAAGNGNIEIVQLLLDAGACVNVIGRNHQIPSHLAAGQRKCEMVQLLLEKGADIEAKNQNGETLLHIAAGNGDVEMVKLLLAKNSEVNVRKNHKKIPLHVAAENGHFEIVQLLLEKGADLNARDDDGNTALHFAVGNENCALVRFLLEKGADYVKNSSNFTPLMLAESQEMKHLLRSHVEAQTSQATLGEKSASSSSQGRFR